MPLNEGSRRQVIYWLALLAITAAALALRVSGLWFFEIWSDEAHTYLTATAPEGVVAALRYDTHPPGYFLLLKAWIALFGGSPVSLRMPSVLAGTAAVAAIAGLMRAAGGSRLAALWAAGLMAVLPLQVYYSQEARSYPLVCLLVVLWMWSLLRAVQRGGMADWALHALCVAAGFYVQYQMLPLVAGLWLGLLTVRPSRRSWIGMLVAHSMAALVALPALVLLIEQTRTANAAGWIADLWATIGPWRAVPRSIEVLGVGGHMPAYVTLPSLPTPLRLVAIACTLLGLLAAFWPTPRPAAAPVASGLGRWKYFFLVLTFWPLLFLLAISLAGRPAYVLGRYDLLAQPALALLLAAGFAGLQMRLARLTPVAGLLIVLPVCGLCIYTSLFGRKSPPLRQQTTRAGLIATYGKPDDVVLALGLEYAPYVYYARQYGLPQKVLTLPRDVAAHPGWIRSDAELHAMLPAIRSDIQNLLAPGPTTVWVLLDPQAFDTPGSARAQIMHLLRSLAQAHGYTVLTTDARYGVGVLRRASASRPALPPPPAPPSAPRP